MSTIIRVLLTSMVALLFTVLSATIALAATTYLSDQVIPGDFKQIKAAGSPNMQSSNCSGCAGGKAHWVNGLVNPSSVGGRWYGHHNNTTTWWNIYVPNNGAASGGTYYFVSNSVHNFSLPLIQANHRGQWVSLGFLDVGNNATTRMYNECYPALALCSNFLYWDDAKYNH